MMMKESGILMERRYMLLFDYWKIEIELLSFSSSSFFFFLGCCIVEVINLMDQKKAMETHTDTACFMIHDLA